MKFRNLKSFFAVTTALFLLTVTLNTAANAAVFTVTTNGDTNDAAAGDGVCADSGGVCTLRAAVQEANALSSDDTINFNANLSGATVTLTSGALTVANNGTLAVNGLGANVLTISGNNSNRLFVINSGTNALIARLTLTNGINRGTNGSNGTVGNPGSNGGAGGAAAGGAILNNGTLRLTTVAVRDSAAIGGSGGRGGNGDDANFGTGGDGGNGGAGGAAFGGGIQNTGVLYLFGCTVSGNQTTAGRGGNGGNGGDGAFGDGDGGNGGNGGSASGNIYNAGTLYITNSTVTSNQATGGIGGIGGDGDSDGQGGAAAQGQGGGVSNVGSSGAARLIHATVSSNAANGSGGGVLNSSAVNLGNTLVANNTGSSSPDFFGALNSLGHNLIENANGAIIGGVTTGNQTGVDPNLSPLQNNGGETLTRALIFGSPAIDAGNNSLSVNPDGIQPLALDQRGVQRIVAANSANAVTDIGAFEALPPSAAPGSLGGRVFDGGNSGIIRRVRVSLLDAATGVERRTQTDFYGFYRFDDLEIGRVYIVRVQSGKYAFAPAEYILQLFENREDVNFTNVRNFM